MQILQGSVNFLLSLGAAIFVPFIIIVAGLLVRMRVKDAVSAGITLGVAFSGMTMLISYMTAAITPAMRAPSTTRSSAAAASSPTPKSATPSSSTASTSKKARTSNTPSSCRKYASAKTASCAAASSTATAPSRTACKSASMPSWWTRRAGASSRPAAPVPVSVSVAGFMSAPYFSLDPNIGRRARIFQDAEIRVVAWAPPQTPPGFQRETPVERPGERQLVSQTLKLTPRI